MQLNFKIEFSNVRAILMALWMAALTHARLRAACPCSACRAQRRAGLTVDADDAVRLTAIEPVGAYALNLAFSDGHRRGIYPYEMLVTL